MGWWIARERLTEVISSPAGRASPGIPVTTVFPGPDVARSP